ncbi:hypothetical protein MUK42_25413 [Musa troglodytarum]|uniref:Uncharacterized protein n=1 Tax=Musa troglodytarum TaxID=320322 RepID=A0A9E7HX31_9LILI|nr:hypothetical protein MUK42_25413 [Musa troglodytarum]
MERQVVNLLEYAKSPPFADGSLAIGPLKGGYKIMTNTVKVPDGFMGLELNSVLRDCVDAQGLPVEAATFGRGIKRWLLIEQGTKLVLLFPSLMIEKCAAKMKISFISLLHVSVDLLLPLLDGQAAYFEGGIIHDRDVGCWQQRRFATASGHRMLAASSNYLYKANETVY